MRKILSLILGLLWVLPAFADLDPCRNLLNTPERLEISKWYKSTGTIVSTDPDTRRFVQFSIQIIKSNSDTPAPSGCAGNFYGPVNNFKCKFTTPENTTSCRFYSNGERVNSGTSTFPCEPNTQYTFSMDVISANPTIRNGIIYSHMQLEKGATATEFTPACTGINVATTKYTNKQFEPLDLMLSNAISVVDTVVSNTITQAASIATLQAQKQTRPNDIADDSEKCPAGKKCLLVEDASGVPHWYEIVTGRLPDGYTELEYIESTGTQWIDTGIYGTDGSSFEIRLSYSSLTGAYQMNGWSSDAQIGIDSGAYWWNKARGITTVTLDTIYNTKLVISGDTSELYVDGNLEKASTLGIAHTVKGFGLFATVEGSYLSKEKVYNFVAKDSANRIVMNLVPAKNSSGVVGMYDLVGGRFYENAGTGTFIGGQPVFN